MPSKLQHLIMASGFLAFAGFAGPLVAQDMGDDVPDTTKETPKEADKPAKPERARGERPAARRSTELARILREGDKDGDQKLSADELGDAELHKKLDTDGDGFLTLQEMMADQAAVVAAVDKAAKAALEEEFKILDRDDSGKLSKEELGANFGKLLETGDTDKDGALNLEEWIAAKNTAKPDAGRERPQGERPQRNPIADMDKDGDGKISKDEAGERLKDMFDKLDADKDGFLTEEEIAAGRKNAERPQRRREGQPEKAPEGEKSK